MLLHIVAFGLDSVWPMAMAMTLPSSTEPKKGTGVTCTGTMELVCGVVQIEDADMNEEPLLDSLAAPGNSLGRSAITMPRFPLGHSLLAFQRRLHPNILLRSTKR